MLPVYQSENAKDLCHLISQISKTCYRAIAEHHAFFRSIVPQKGEAQFHYSDETQAGWYMIQYRFQKSKD
jgi:hypothetical protein